MWYNTDVMASYKYAILGGTTALSAATVAGRITSFLSVLLITRSMSLVEYGSLMLAFSLGGPLSFFSGLGLDAALVADSSRAIGEGRSGRAKRLILSFARQKMLVTVILLFAGWLFAPLLVERFGQNLADYFFWIVLWAASNTVASLFGIILQIYGRFPIVAVTDGADSFFRFIIITGFFFFSAVTPIAVIIASIVAKILSQLFALPVIYKIFGAWRKIVGEGTGWWALWRAHGKWNTVSQGIIPQIDSTVRPWMINFFFGPAVVALLDIPSRIFGALTTVFPIHKVTMPLIARTMADRPRAVRIAQASTKLSVWAAIFLTVSSGLLIGPFIRIFFPQYEASIVLFWVLAPRLILLALGSSHDALFQALRTQRKLVAYQFVGVVSDVTLLPLALKVTGVMGIYVERFIAIATVVWFRERFFRQRYGISTIVLQSYVRLSREDRDTAREMFLRLRQKLHI